MSGFFAVLSLLTPEHGEQSSKRGEAPRPRPEPPSRMRAESPIDRHAETVAIPEELILAASVRVEGLRRHFTGSPRPAVDDVDLEVDRGQTLCLVGPSGCGKSTTLRLVAGLDEPDGGTIRIDDRPMSGVPPQERDVAMVFQGFALYPHMVVKDIMAFPLKMRKVPLAQREKAVRDAAALLNISSLLDRLPAQLSGGEQQRVAMGRAIVRQPKVFLFDEPLSNLDAALRAELRVELAKLLRRLEATAIYVTHDQAEAMTLGHRIGVMREGKLEQVASPREIYERPTTSFVAGFFGSPPMNLLDAERDGDVARAGAIAVKAPSGNQKKLTLGIRPERLRFGDGGDARGTVVSVEPHGAESHVEVDIDGAIVRARVAGFSSFEPGSEVSVGLDDDALHWFDGETGLAL